MLEVEHPVEAALRLPEVAQHDVRVDRDRQDGSGLRVLVEAGERSGLFTPASDPPLWIVERSVPQGCGDAHREIDVPGVDGPSERGPQVLQVGFEPAGPGLLVGAEQSGPGPAGKRHEVRRVAGPHDIGASAGFEVLARVLAHRLE